MGLRRKGLGAVQTDLRRAEFHCWARCEEDNVAGIDVLYGFKQNLITQGESGAAVVRWQRSQPGFSFGH